MYGRLTSVVPPIPPHNPRSRAQIAVQKGSNGASLDVEDPEGHLGAPVQNEVDLGDGIEGIGIVPEEPGKRGPLWNRNRRNNIRPGLIKDLSVLADRGR